MKLNNKGFAISTVMYMMLVLSFVLIMATLGLLSSRRITLDKVKSITLSDIKTNMPKKRYKIGDAITINKELYYVISPSPKGQEYVTLLKEKPLTVDEVNTYGEVGAKNNHVNKYTGNSIGKAVNENSYGALAYYSSESCGIKDGKIITDGCITDYRKSDIKYVIDVWAKKRLRSVNLMKIDGYFTRLITSEELNNILGYDKTSFNKNPNWLYNRYYQYWTMSMPQKSTSDVMVVDNGGSLNRKRIFDGVGCIRPVINVAKFSIQNNRA